MPLPPQPIFSYICFEQGTSDIVHIREKVAISRHANTGAYAFPCGEKLRSFCREVLDNPVGKAGEFYTSSIIEGMIHAGQKVGFSVLGNGQSLPFLHGIPQTRRMVTTHQMVIGC